MGLYEIFHIQYYKITLDNYNHYNESYLWLLMLLNLCDLHAVVNAP